MSSFVSLEPESEKGSAVVIVRLLSYSVGRKVVVRENKNRNWSKFDMCK